MQSMKAVRIHSYGGPEVLAFEDVPRPTAGPNEVLVRVHAASINPVDWKLREGYLREHVPLSLPLTLGLDFSGVIEGVGMGVRGLQAGDEVYAMMDIGRSGAYAEYAVVDASLVAPKPRKHDHIHAAAFPLAGLTAWHGLFESGGLQSGQKVLIHGATGGVGSFAVQLARQAGAIVIGTASTRNQSLLKELGVDQAIDYQAGPFEKAVSQADLVLDTVGGETQRRSWPVLKKGGILASTVSEPLPPTPDRAGKYIANRPDAQGLRVLAEAADSGALHAIVETVLPLSEARKGQEMSGTGHTRGKIVLKAA